MEVETRLRLLRVMLASRLGDLREQSLIRQGKGWFHVSGMGHEALAAVGALLGPDDYFAGYYRDRPIALGRGFSTYDLALAFFAKRASASGGRQMPAHYSSKELGVFSVASVVGASLLPACGFAWGLKLDGRRGAVVTTVGDAGTRQGDFYEAICFAKERQLPVLFLVEDNGIGISSPTARIHPLALGVLERDDWQVIDACCVSTVAREAATALEAIRAGAGPRFLWCRTERISSHSSADDHRKYRSVEELSGLEAKDCLNRLKAELVREGVLTEKGYQDLHREVEEEVRRDYERASQQLDPEPREVLDHIFGPEARPPRLKVPLEARVRMVDAINRTFRAGLESSPDYVFFGQDIEDPKGGVFSLTKGLSTDFPERVANSPLAESTIIGVSVGLAAYGKRPVFEVQFTDFIWAGFNQLVTHLSTLHWRTQGEWAAPAILYAPYGAYLPGGAIWHSQANEGALAHFPGLQIGIPSTPEDAAGLFWTAMHGKSPTLMLIPKHLLWHPSAEEVAADPVPFGKARVRRAGDGVTIVAWGNTVEVAEQALALLEKAEAERVELIDLRSIVPLDRATVAGSVAKTGRLLVVEEDGRTCSVGQSVIEGVVSDGELFGALKTHPRLLAKPDVPVPYNPILEFACLPSKQEVAEAVREMLREERAAAPRRPAAEAEVQDNPALRVLKETFAGPTDGTLREVSVPVLGEGITTARVIRLLVEPGQPVRQDDPLCELETDKALFPVEASFAGVLAKWQIREGDEVEVEQVIALVEAEEAAPARPVAPVPERGPTPEHPTRLRPTEGGLSPHIVAQMKNVVPTHMVVKVGWEAIREARAQSKRQSGDRAASPTVMIAWALVRAMEKHPIFTCTVTANDTLTPHESFDFGVAVSMPNDALDTAIIAGANRLDWEGFLEAYRQSVERVRRGQMASKAGTPLILTSMGGFSVRDASPVVVPPAIGTLFVGEAHWEPGPQGQASEVVNLCLSFDHRWINGVAGAHFLHDVRQTMESFSLPVRR